MKGRKKYSNVEEVYKKLQLYLSNEIFAEGQRIPSEREIAENLNVNRTTLRQAMHKMVEVGYLERRIGAGTYTKVTSSVLKNIDNFIADYSPEELVEIRIILEPQIAMLAAAQANLRDIDLLKEISEVKKQGEFEDRDIDFNEYLAKISGNGLLQRLYLDVSTVRKKFSTDKNLLITNEKPQKKIKEKPKATKGEKQNIIKVSNHYELWKMHQDKVIIALENHLAKAAEEAVRNKLFDLLFGGKREQ